jgi:hypothetical protein
MRWRQLLWLGLLAAVSVAGVRAEDWNHDANIDSAVQAMVAVHSAGGMSATVVFINDCYRSIDASQSADGQLQRLEYCAGMDFAAFLLERQTQPDAGNPDSGNVAPFFAAPAMFERMQRLDQWVRDPATNHQILRAWAASAADSLAGLRTVGW